MENIDKFSKSIEDIGGVLSKAIAALMLLIMMILEIPAEQAKENDEIQRRLRFLSMLLINNVKDEDMQELSVVTVRMLRSNPAMLKKFVLSAEGHEDKARDKRIDDFMDSLKKFTSDTNLS